jgi:hypothetical protein
MNAGFDFARQLTRVKSPSEFFELSAAPPDGHSRQPVSNFLSKLWSALRQAAFAAAKSLTTTSPFRFFFEDGGGAFTSNSTSNMLYPQTFAPLSASVLGGALSFGQPVVLTSATTTAGRASRTHHAGVTGPCERPEPFRRRTDIAALD